MQNHKSSKTKMKAAENSHHPKDRKAWRKWLEKNHLVKDNVHLILYRKAGKNHNLTYEEAVEEALCFGWIDSQGSKRDEESSFLYFSKRKPKSAWSKLNKDRVKRLSKQKLIAPAGQAMIDHAKKSGTWNILDDVEKMIVPKDLEQRFSKNKTALKNFNAFPPGVRKVILGWINYAKQESTRKKRIEETVTLAAKNIRANRYTPKK